MLILFPILVLAGMVMSPSLVMAVPEEGTAALKTCTGGFEDDYFNFHIDIDKFAEGCEAFDEIAATIQSVIEEIRMCIPEYEKEFIEAQICPNPTYLGEGEDEDEGVEVEEGGQEEDHQRRSLFLRSLAVRRKRNRRAGQYSFAGTGGCRRCKRSNTARRRHLSGQEETSENDSHHPVQLNSFVTRALTASSRHDDPTYESLEQHICSVSELAAVDSAVADRAVKAAEKKIREIEASEEREAATKSLYKRNMDERIKEAKKKLEDLKETRQMAKSRAFFVKNTCSAIGSVVLDEDEQGYLYTSIADDLEKYAAIYAKGAQQDYYKVKDQTIYFKSIAIKSKFYNIADAMAKEEEKLEAEILNTVDAMEEEKYVLEDEKQAALQQANEEREKGKEESEKDNKDAAHEHEEKAKEQEEKAKELENKQQDLDKEANKLWNDFEKLKDKREKQFDKDYEFAMNVLDVEAANSFEDYCEAFADLLKPVLEDRLGNEYDACFEKDGPKVDIEVVELEKKADQMKEKDCPDEDGN